MVSYSILLRLISVYHDFRVGFFYLEQFEASALVCCPKLI